MNANWQNSFVEYCTRGGGRVFVVLDINGREQYFKSAQTANENFAGAFDDDEIDHTNSCED